MTRALSTQDQLVHVGRQAIHDRTGRVIGFELLFRGDSTAVVAERRTAHATSQVIVSSFAGFGLDQLVGDKLCFLNLTREFLVGELPLPFPPGQVVLEILETVDVDAEVIAGVATLVEQGFPIALDDFVWGQGHEKLLKLASYVKLDLLETDQRTLVSTVFAARRHAGVALVAERVENPELDDLARRFGFDFFQGHTYGLPETLSAVALNPSRVRRLELFGVLAAADVHLDQVVAIVTADPALSYRILQATNSAANGLLRKVSSVREAIMLLGIERIRQWVALMLVSDISEATEEQLTTLMTRARQCQAAAEDLQVPPDAAFTVGLLASVADLVNEPVSSVVARLPLAPEVVAALVRGEGRLGQVLELVRAQEP